MIDAQTKIVSAQLLQATLATPAFCDVFGVISPSIQFEVALPVAWNQRLYVTGNGDLACDFLNSAGDVSSRNLGVANGFAYAHTDTGHSTNDGHNGTWAVNRPGLVIDWAYRAIHATDVAAKELVAILYSQKPRFAYFSGCSDGGREGFEEAQRFPDDFNGIVAGTPWISPIDTFIWEAWIDRAFAPLGETTDQLVAKMQYVTAQVYAKCDALDGVQDGLINEPRRCLGVFDPKKDLTLCPAGTNGANCVTAAERAAYEKTIDPIITGGRPHYPPAALGTNYIASIFSGDNGLADAMMTYIFPFPASGNFFSVATFNFNCRSLPRRGCAPGCRRHEPSGAARFLATQGQDDHLHRLVRPDDQSLCQCRQLREPLTRLRTSTGDIVSALHGARDDALRRRRGPRHTRSDHAGHQLGRARHRAEHAARTEARLGRSERAVRAEPLPVSDGSEIPRERRPQQREFVPLRTGPDGCPVRPCLVESVTS